MSTEQPQVDLSSGAERLPSVAALQALHKDLLHVRRQDGDSDALYDRIAALIHRGQLTGALLDAEGDRSTAQAILDYWSAILFKAGRPAPDATLAEFNPSLAPEIPDDACPYVGLDPFREQNQGVFFGRERMVAALLERLKADRLLVVVGSSGCGKSSIVLAGLLPALKGSALPGSEGWRYAPRMVPGSQPLANLVRVLSAMQVQEPEDPAQWAREQEDLLRSNPHHLVELANGALAATAADEAPIVGVVDQFEEVFTLGTDEHARRAFLDNLANLVRTPQAAHRVILTMRTDFEPFVARFPEFQSLFEPAVVRVTPLTAAELRDAIEKPAQMVGLKFESGLVEQLLHDVLGEPAALPLLQFTLLKLWDHRARNRITWQAYNRLGGGRLALARSADEFYDALIPEEQTTAKRIFLRLVRPGEGLEFTSNRVRARVLYETGEAPDRVQRVLDKLIAARLVRVTEGDVAADAQIEVAHEALVRNWPRLVTWLEEERHTLRQRQVVTDAAAQWNTGGRDPGLLYTTETSLAEALRVVSNSGIPLNEQEAEFIAASQRGQEAAREAQEALRRRELDQAQKLAEAERQRADDQSRAARRLRWLTVALAGLALVAVAAAVFAANSTARAVTESAAAAQAAQQEAAIRKTAEAQATQVAENLLVAQGALAAQVDLINQVEQADADKAALVAQIEADRAALAEHAKRIEAERDELVRHVNQLETAVARPPAEPTPGTPVAPPPVRPTRPVIAVLPTYSIVRPVLPVITATAEALYVQRSQVYATQTAMVSASGRFVPVPLGRLANGSTEEGYAKPPIGNVNLGGVPFELPGGPNSITTQAEPLPQHPTRIELGVDVPRPRQVYLLITGGDLFTKFEGKQIGLVRLHFAGGRSFTQPLVAGEHIREWKLLDPVTVASTTSRSVQEVWRTNSRHGGTGIIDMLTVDVSDVAAESLIGIEVVDMSQETVGSLDPAINLVGVTVLGG